MPLQSTDINGQGANGYTFNASGVTYVIKQGAVVRSDLAGVYWGDIFTGHRIVNDGLIGARTGMQLYGNNVNAVNAVGGEIIAEECTSVSADNSVLTNTSANYYEHSVASSVDTIGEAAAYAASHAPSSARHAFVYNSAGDIGFLLMDLNGNGSSRPVSSSTKQGQRGSLATLTHRSL